MFSRQRGTTLAFVLLAVVGLWGCSDSDDIVNPEFDPQDVQVGAEAAALAQPDQPRKVREKRPRSENPALSAASSVGIVSTVAQSQVTPRV